MSAQVNITGSSTLEVARKKKAVEKILNNLNADQLERLSSLADSQKAKDYLGSSIKFQTLKTFL